MELILTVTPSIHEKRDTLDINGYLYIYNRQYQRKTDDNLVFYWICRCGARIQTIFKNNIHIIDLKGKPFSINDHSHGPDPQYLQVKKVKQGIKRKADETNDTTSKIYQESIISTSVSIASQISKNSTRCLIKRRRMGHTCSEPKSINEISVPEILKIHWITNYF